LALKPDDDTAAHPIGHAPHWRESYYCNFFNVQDDTYGLAWIGVRPNVERGEALFAIFDKDVPLLRYVDFKVPVARDIGAERKHLGPLNFRCVAPYREWEIGFDDSRSQALVKWRRMSDVCDWDWEDLTASKHYQHAGRVEVEANIEGRQVRFSGTGERDRAWGERDYGFWRFVWWLVVQFPDDVASHVFLMRDENGEGRLHGYLHKAGRTRPVSRYQAQVTYSYEGGPPEQAVQLITDDEGRTLRLTEMQRMNYFAFTADGPQVEDAPPPDGLNQGLMYWTFNRYQRDDGVMGRGMIDHVCWKGYQQTDIDARGPVRSTLYPFGRDDGEEAKG